MNCFTRYWVFTNFVVTLFQAPPYSDERINGPVLVPNFPPSILVQESYDSREIEQRLASKALQFIRENANKKV